MADQITSGIYVRLEIHIDKQSVPSDGFALGACVRDLEREGWMLDSFCMTFDGGITALVTRGWRIGIPLQRRANMAATIGTEAKEPA